MFKQNGLIKNTLMSVLQKTLQVVMSERIADIPDYCAWRFCTDVDHPVAIWHTTYIHWNIQRVWDTRIRSRRCCICDWQIFCRMHKGILALIETNERGDVPRSCAFWGYASSPEKCYRGLPRFYTSATRQHSFIIGGGRACWDEQMYN